MRSNRKTKSIGITLALAAIVSFAATASAQSAQPPETPATNSKAKKTNLSFEKMGAISYREINGETLNCDVYVPEGDGPYPAVLAIHGGAWRHGSKITMTRHAWKLARAGYVVVAVNYRHAPKHPFPAQVHDCKQAVRWMRANAEKYKIDAERIAAFGYSAGGHLAAMLGTTDGEDGLEPSSDDELSQYSSRVQAVIAGGAPCDFEWIDGDASTLVYWLGCKRADRPEVYAQASPTTYVTKDDPPFYFFHGESDLLVPKNSSCRLHQRLINCGVPSKHDIAINLGHVATFSDLSWMTKAIEFLDAQLAEESNSAK
jgi:acetyl esterase/lipase